MKNELKRLNLFISAILFVLLYIAGENAARHSQFEDYANTISACPPK